jgi:hypothetical protein
MKNTIFILVLAFFSLFAVENTAYAQCAMCRAAPGSNLAAGGKDGAGLNKGIFYMFIAPYCIVATMGFLWWRGRKQYIAEAQETEIKRVLDEASEEV